MGDLFSGQNLILEYNIGTEAVPDWHEVGFQVGGDLSIDTSPANVTTKNHNGWTISIPTVSSWSMSLECRLELSDDGIAYLEGCARNRVLASIRWRMKKAPTKAWRGRANVTSYKVGAPADDAIPVNISFAGYGELITETPPATA